MGDRARIALAFLVIIGILFVWTMMNRPAQQTAPPKPAVEDTVADTGEVVIDVAAPAEQETVVVDRERIKVVLSDFGGSVKSFYLKEYNVEIVPPGRNLFVSYTGDSANRVMAFDYTADGDSVTFRHSQSGKTTVKTYHFDRAHGFSLHVSSGATPQTLGLKSGLNVTEKKNRSDDLRNFNVYLKNGKVENITKKVKERYEYTGEVDWFALRSKYFILLVDNNAVIDRLLFYKFPDQGEEAETRKASFGCYYMGGGKNRYGAEIRNAGDIDITVLLLPMDRRELAQYDKGYDGIASGGLWDPISRVIMAMLNFIYSLIGNYGFAIMIFAILIKVVFFPLSRQMIVSQHKMQMIQPELKKIQQKYKDEPQRLNQEMMHLYKTYKVNPFTGCLPLLLQMPIFFALFRALTTSIEFRHASFLFWITDLSAKDPFYVLPISMGVMMVIQSLTTTVDPRQRLMVIFMPIFMVWIFLSLPSGLQLYWFTYNILTLIEHFVIKRGGLK
jgi:YidC/Oxa1 family membrane protein insertase